MELKDEVEAGVVREMHTDISPSMADKSGMVGHPCPLNSQRHAIIIFIIIESQLQDQILRYHKSKPYLNLAN